MNTENWFKAFIKINDKLGFFIEYVPWLRQEDPGFVSVLSLGVVYPYGSRLVYTADFVATSRKLARMSVPEALIPFYNSWGGMSGAGASAIFAQNPSLYWKLKKELFDLFAKLEDNYKIVYKALGQVSCDGYKKLRAQFTNSIIGFTMPELSELMQESN